jgi:SCY1-like protein 1
MALAATVDIFADDDCATKLLPSICPFLVDKEKMIRDQANKTLNVYLERVRKYSNTLPDTVLPPPESTSAGGTRVNSPQLNAGGGVQAGSQWMGWAISSFTNKLGTATGEMQSEGNATAAARPDLNRSNSTPSSSTSASKTSLPSSSSLHGSSHLAHNNSSPAIPKISSGLRNTTTPAATSTPVVEDEDFGADAWGDLDDDYDDNAAAADGWDTPLTNSTNNHKPSSSISSSKATTTSVYDDGGEPDFEGWLAAQSNKSSAVGGKKPLPKGLVKKTTSTTTTGAAATRANKPIFPANVKKASSTTPAVVAKKVVPVKKEEEVEQQAEGAEQDDDWGDAWN